MNIIATQYTASKRSLDIYTAGCKAPHCKGCFNPETWDFNQGNVWNEVYFDKIKSKVKDFSSMIDNLMVFGGEPLDNPIDEITKFLKDLSVFKLPIWLFTKRAIDDVPEEIKNLCSYIKCGRYEEDKRIEGYIQYGMEIASTNQIIYKFNR